MCDNKLNILLADDEIHIRLIIKTYYEPYNVNIVEARDGQEAIDALKKNAIDLVILDYSMPIIQGQQVLDFMMSDEKLEKVPVIVYTAGGFEKNIENRLKASATAFLEKSNIGEDLIPTTIEIVGSRLKMKDPGKESG